MGKLDLSKLQGEIEQRKRDKGISVQSGGFSGGQPKDEFLHKLMNSLESGVVSESIDRIKMVDNRASEKLNEKPNYVQPRRAPQTQHNQINEDEDREEIMWENVQRGRKSTIYDELDKHNRNYTQQYNQPQFNPQQHYQQPQMMNEQYVVNLVENALNNFIGENFNRVIEDSIKNVVFEMYASERIKEALVENKDIIKKEILLVLREMSNRKKK